MKKETAWVDFETQAPDANGFFVTTLKHSEGLVYARYDSVVGLWTDYAGVLLDVDKWHPIMSKNESYFTEVR